MNDQTDLGTPKEPKCKGCNGEGYILSPAENPLEQNIPKACTWCAKPQERPAFLADEELKQAAIKAAKVFEEEERNVQKMHNGLCKPQEGACRGGGGMGGYTFWDSVSGKREGGKL